MPLGFVLSLVMALVLTGCTVGPSSRPAVLQHDGPASTEAPPRTTEAPVPPLGEPENAAIDWRPCDTETRKRLGSRQVPESLRFSCARVAGTVDSPSLPDRGLIRLALLKVGRGDVPLVVVNDVDGEPGTVYAARLAAKLPPEVLDRFSLIGMDRRYTGQSKPNTCVPAETRAQLLGHDPANPDLEPLLDAARKAGQQCSIDLGNDQGALDTWRGAGDLDRVRSHLGMSRLHAIGRGEGSRVLGVYATRFPAQTGRIALDGMPDPSEDAATVLGGVAAGAETTLRAFAKDCARRDCPLGSDARKVVNQLVDRLRDRPLPTPRTGRMGPSAALHAIRAGLAERDRWPELATAIADARKGKASKLAVFVEPIVRPTAAGPATVDTTLATKCNDTLSRLTPDRITATIEDFRAKHPVFGGVAAQQLAWCEPWPVRREPLVTPDGRGAPPVLMISTAADPVTPELGTVRAGSRMVTAVPLAWEGAGHGALGQSTCIDEKVTEFLIEGALPEKGTICPA